MTKISKFKGSGGSVQRNAFLKKHCSVMLSGHFVVGQKREKKKKEGKERGEGRRRKKKKEEERRRKKKKSWSKKGTREGERKEQLIGLGYHPIRPLFPLFFLLLPPSPCFPPSLIFRVAFSFFFFLLSLTGLSLLQYSGVGGTEDGWKRKDERRQKQSCRPRTKNRRRLTS